MIRPSSSIDDLEISSRSRNVLHRQGIHTVGAMLELDEEQLFNFPNMGKKSVDEVLQLISMIKEGMTEENHTPVFSGADEWLDHNTGKQFAVSYLKKNGITIDALDALSTKAYNLLSFADKEELYKVIFLNEEDLLKIPRMDRSDAKEILMNTQYYLRQNKEKMFEAYQASGTEEKEKTIDDYLNDPKEKEKILHFVKTNDLSIGEMNLSFRAFNGLDREGLHQLSDIFFMNESQLRNIPKMGKGSAAEIVDRIKIYTEQNRDRIIAFCSGDESVNYTDDMICSRIIALYKDRPFAGLSFKEIYEQSGLNNDVIEARVKELIGHMLEKHLLEYVDYRCYRIYPKFSEYFDHYEDINERNRIMIEQRLEGKTLQEISVEVGLTRERVRQLIDKEYRKLKRKYSSETGVSSFDEDYYRYFLETYIIPRKDCERWLGIPEKTYCYINLTGKTKGKEILESAVDDLKLNLGLRIRIEKYLNRDKLLINGIYVKKNRMSIEDILIPECCKETISYSEFYDRYNQTLEDNHIPYDPDIYYTEEIIRTRKNRLADSRLVLWTVNESIRYYDIDARDYTELLDTLNLEAYENTEISTKLFFENYPETMAKYDIRNQYELHNLLRKIIPEGSYHDFKCSRMPVIQFGVFDRAAAIYNIMAEHAPISSQDLAQLVYEEYGYEPASLLASPDMQKLNVYYHQGIYSVDWKEMSEEQEEKLKEALPEDFYYIEEIRTIFRQLYPDEEQDVINPHTLKHMGFLVYERTALKNHASLERYFRYLLTKDDVFDITAYRKRFTYVSMFSNILVDLKREHTIFEFSQNQYIHIRKLEEAGYSRDDINNFIDDVYEYTEEGAYFNSYSLTASGFSNDLYNIGFENEFYTNILCTDSRFSFAKLFSGAVLYKGKKDLTTKAFLQDLIHENGIMDYYDLENELSDTYGLTVPDKNSLIYKLDNTSVYYDRILDRFYASKDLYYKELDESEGL